MRPDPQTPRSACPLFRIPGDDSGAIDVCGGVESLHINRDGDAARVGAVVDGTIPSVYPTVNVWA